MPKFDLSETPWKEGYKYAQLLRRELMSEDKIFPHLDDIGEILNLGPSGLSTQLIEIDSARLFDALVATTQNGDPGVAVDKKSDGAKKFAFCRGLFEFLNSTNGAPLLVTRTQTERQKRNRAFAAEFLAPSSLLRTRVHDSIVYQEEIDEIAEEFGVSPLVIVHQLNNHNLVKEIVD